MPKSRMSKVDSPLEPDRVVVDHGQRHVVLDGSSHGPEGEVAADKEAAIVCARVRFP